MASDGRRSGYGPDRGVAGPPRGPGQTPRSRATYSKSSGLTVQSASSGAGSQSSSDGSGSKGTGRHADSPKAIPAPGWKQIGKRSLKQLKKDHVSLLAAGVAFKALLALFPAIIAAISVWGLIASPQQITAQLSGFLNALPQSAASVLEQQMTQVAGQNSGALSFALALSVLLAFWSASAGVAGLMEGCNAAYEEVESRSFFVKRGIALLLTIGAILFVLVAIGLIAVVPAVLGAVGLGSTAELLIRILKWPLLAVAVMVALAILYKYGPDRDHPQMRWASWGAGIATVLWLIGSAVFTVYVENFGSFGATYGTLSGIIILMLWLYLSSFAVLFGAEINAEIERQTVTDTTVGDPEPMGQRGAMVADTAPEEQAEQAR